MPQVLRWRDCGANDELVKGAPVPARRTDPDGNKDFTRCLW